MKMSGNWNDLVLRICNPHYDAVVNHTLFCV